GSPGPHSAGGRSARAREPGLLTASTIASAPALLAREAQKWSGDVGALSSAARAGGPASSIMTPAALVLAKVVAPAFSAAARSLTVPSTLVRKNGSRGPENRNNAAACTTASTAGKGNNTLLSRLASTGNAPNARSFAWDDAERVRANT